MSVIAQASFDPEENCYRPYQDHSIGRSASCFTSNETLKDSLASSVKQPEHKYPGHESQEERMLSFGSSWKLPYPLTVIVMATAGFFYEGHSDAVRCFSCGLGIRGWEEHNDPVEEHVYLTDDCPFLEDKMGEDKFQETKKRLTKLRNPNQSPELGRRSYINDFGANRRYDNCKMSSYQADETPTTFEDLEKDTERLRNNVSCRGCGNVGSNVLFLYCGHMLYCMGCASSVRTCPVCGILVQKVQKVYLA